jgi:hypothetical protein
MAVDKDKFAAIYNESRNGCNGFIRHALSRSFAYSDGVQELAELGCYWLLDILATELPAVFKENEHVSSMCIVKVVSSKPGATFTGEFKDGVVAWSKTLGYADIPYGEWIFYIADDGEGSTPYRMILPGEH